MSRLETRLEHLYYTPLSEKRHHFFIDDLNIDTLNALKRDGIQPNCVLESSRGNYQAIFTLDKLGTRNEQYLINNIATNMNRYYGDVNFCGAIHPHRAPGFYNTKPERREPDGSFFETRIIETNREQCKKLADYLMFMDCYADWRRNRPKKISIPQRAHMVHNFSQNSAKNLFLMYRRDVMRINSLTETDQDRSRVDFMIATRLRATGHTQEEIAEILLIGNNAISRDNKWDLEAYAQRTAESAFTSPDADRAIEKLSSWIPSWTRRENAILRPEHLNHTTQQEQRNVERERNLKNHELDAYSAQQISEKPRDDRERSMHHMR